MKQYRDIPELIEAVILYTCPMCRAGEPLDEEGYHPKDQHCYARTLRKIIQGYEVNEENLKG